MSKGKIHKYFYYPGYLGLERGWLVARIENQIYSIAIKDHVNGLEIYDLNNKLIYIDGKIGDLENPIQIKGMKDFSVLEHKNVPNFKIGINVTGNKRLIKSYFFTEILICKEVEDVKNPNIHPEEFEKVLSKLILDYRIVSKDGNIILPQEAKFQNFMDGLKYHEYSEEDLKLPIEERLKIQKQNISYLEGHSYIILDMKELVLGKIPKHDFSKATDLIKPYLENNVVSESLHKVALAYDQINLDKNLNHVFLELFIYIESVIFKFLEIKKIESGVSKGKLEDYESEVGIGYMLNVELPIFFPNVNQKVRQILGDLDNVRKLRNRVVHKSYNATKKEILNAVKAVDKFLAIMRKIKAVT